MEDQNITTSPAQKKNVVMPIAVAVVLVLLIAGYAMSQPKDGQAPTQSPNMIVNEQTVSSPVAMTLESSYKDGTYKATGNYVSPGGPREIDITITIVDNVITETTFVGKAEDPASKRFQGEFRDGYKEMVVGKRIDEIALTKVSGSSLTPKGFNDAVAKIKAEAAI